MLVRQLATSMATAKDNPQEQLAIISSLSRTIEDSVNNSIPVQLLRGGPCEKTTEQILALIISKSASMLSVGGNIQPEHPIEIARMLLTEFPLCSLDDFQIMLQRGIIGKYGKIMRFDVSVIFSWAKEFMNEWAEAKEKQLANQKSNRSQEETKLSDKTKKIIDGFVTDLSEAKKVPAITMKEIWTNGQERPKKKMAEAPVREEFIVGDPCDCNGNGCAKCSWLGKINAKKVHAESQEEAQKMYELSKIKK